MQLCPPQLDSVSVQFSGPAKHAAGLYEFRLVHRMPQVAYGLAANVPCQCATFKDTAASEVVRATAAEPWSSVQLDAELAAPVVVHGTPPGTGTIAVYMRRLGCEWQPVSVLSAGRTVSAQIKL